MSDITSLAGLAQKFRTMVADLDVEACYKSFHTTPQHDGSPHIETEKGKFQFVITERGSELRRIGDLSAEDVLYLLFKGVTRRMATKYELQNRMPGTDSRSIWFPYQERLMGDLNPAWGERLGEEHRRILGTHPIPNELDISLVVGELTTQVRVGQFDLQFTFGPVNFAVQSPVHLFRDGKVVGRWEEGKWPDPAFYDIMNAKVMRCTTVTGNRIEFEFENGLAMHLADSSDQYESMQIRFEGNPSPWII